MILLCIIFLVSSIFPALWIFILVGEAPCEVITILFSFNFVGMSVELASLHGQVYDLSRIRVCQNEVNDASLEIVSEPRLPSQNNENGVSLETMVEPNLDSQNEKSETVAELHLTSPNNGNRDMEDDEGPGKTNVIEVSGHGLNDEFLTVRGNETAEPSESPLLSENKLEEVDYVSMADNVSQERTKPTNDMGANDSQQELSLHVDVIGTSLINAGAASPVVIAEVEPLDSTGHAAGNMGNASDGMVLTTSLNESGEINAYVNTDAAVVLDQKKAAPLVELDYADDDGQAIVRNEFTEKDGNASREGETELGAKDDILPDVTQDAPAVELVPNASHGELEYNAQSETYSATSKEQREVEFSCSGLVSVLQDGSMFNCESLDHLEAYQPNMMDAEISGFDLHDRDVSFLLVYNF